MASQISHLPHIKNVKAATERWDPIYNSIFLVAFTVPYVLAGEYNQDEVQILSQQVESISGLDSLNETVNITTKKYLGVDVAFTNPIIENTGADITIIFNLNLRNISDAYVYKLFKQWSRLIYDVSTGVHTLKQMCSGLMTILEANRDGTIWRQLVLKNVIITKLTGLEDLNYSSQDIRHLSVQFHADYWDETIG